MAAHLDSLALALTADPQAVGDRYVIQDRPGGGAKWFRGLSNTGAVTNVNHALARRNARTAMQDTPLARAIVERMADTVADVGLKLELSPVIEMLGISRENADAWARDVSLRFDMWARDKKQHRSEQLTFYQYQRLYAFFQQRENDVFTRLFYNRDGSLQNPLQFECLDPEQIRGDAWTTSAGFQCGQDGIERDDRGREKSFKVWVRNQNGTYTDIDVAARGYSGRLHMLHGFRPEYAGQGRGYSRLSHAIQEFENLTDFSVSAIKKAINQSQIMGFVEPSDDEDATNPMEEIMTDAGAGPASRLYGSEPQQVDGVPVVPPSSVQSVYQIPEATLMNPGSTFVTNLTKGSTLKFPNASTSAESYDKFVDAFAGYLSASTGTPLEVVLMKFGQNYSASRATLLLFWRIVTMWRAEMDADLYTPVIEMWLSGEIAAGRISAPGWSDPRMRAAWMNHTLVGSAPPDIDPVKTANAAKTNVEIGAVNAGKVSRDLNGSDAASNIERNRKLYSNYVLPPWLAKKVEKGGSAVLDEIKMMLDDLTGG